MPVLQPGWGVGEELLLLLLGALTGMELEEQLHRIVVEMAAIKDDLDEWGQAALASSGD